MSHCQPNESSKSGSKSPRRYKESLPSPLRARVVSNPSSLRIGEILELRRQIAEQKEALEEKMEQEFQIYPQLIRVQAPPFDRDAILDHPDIVSAHDYVPDGRINWNDPNFRIEDWCEPDCPFDSDGNYIDPETNDDEKDDMKIDSSSESENKEEEEEDDDDSESEDRFVVDLSIYMKVSYEHFDFHHWLKEFGLICIKEILVHHNLETKDMWTEDNFKPILSHPLLKRDTLLTNKIDTMLKIFSALKRQYFTGKGVWQSDDDDNDDNNNRNGTDVIYRRPNKNEEPKTWDEALLKQHFENPEADFVPFKGINFKINKMPAMPEMPPIPPMPMDFIMHQMPAIPEIPSMLAMSSNLQCNNNNNNNKNAGNLQHHFK